MSRGPPLPAAPDDAGTAPGRESVRKLEDLEAALIRLLARRLVREILDPKGKET